MTFRVGQKVVCIHSDPMPGRCWREHDDIPQKGAVYTIAGVAGELVSLIEISRSPFSRDFFGFDGYGAFRFRPIVERKTDISFAHEILRKATKPARTPAMSQHHRGTENG